MEVDSLKRNFIEERGALLFDGSDFVGQAKMDTTYYKNNIIKSVGAVALDKNGSPTALKTGEWITYHENGKVKATGQFKIEALLGCCSARACVRYNSYKVGEWTYYYSNGEVKAKGTYRHSLADANTGVQGQFIHEPVTTREWTFFSADKKPLKDIRALRMEIETNQL